MLKSGDALKDFVKNAVIWSLVALGFLGFYPGLLFGMGAAVAGVARHARRYGDLLVRGLGFLIMALAVFLLHTDLWLGTFAVSLLLWVALLYALAYVLRIRQNSDFLERNLLGMAAVGAISAFILAYPSTSSAVLLLFYLFASLAVFYLAYLVSSYLSSRWAGSEDLTPLPLPDLEPKRDAYSRDLERVVRAFVEKGDSAPLLVFVVRNASSLYTPHLEEIIRPIANYREASAPSLTPPWVVEKMALEERRRRAVLVKELVRRLKAHGGIRGA